MKRIILFLFLGVISCSKNQPKIEHPISLDSLQIPLQVTGTVIQHDSIPTSYVKVRPVSVWIPPNYAESNESYPVVYFMDGQNIFDPKLSFIGVDWSIDEWADSLMKSNQIKNAIIVGIWNTEDRGPEYFPQKAEQYVDSAGMKQLVKRYGPYQPKADNFLKYVTENVMPFINQTYRTKTGRDETIIGGSSMGGLISLYALSEYPHVFGTAICVSTHWPIAEGLTLEYFKRLVPNAGNHRIYFDYGTKTLDETYEPYQLKMDAYMKEKGYKQGKDWVTIKFEGHEHSERDWRKRVDGMLVFALGK